MKGQGALCVCCVDDCDETHCGDVVLEQMANTVAEQRLLGWPIDFFGDSHNPLQAVFRRPDVETSMRCEICRRYARVPFK